MSIQRPNPVAMEPPGRWLTTIFPTALANVGACNPIVWVASGVVAPVDSYVNGTAFLPLPPGIQLYGGFVGTESALSQRDWRANPTHLSGIGTSGTNRNAVVGISSGLSPVGTGATIVDGFIIENGGQYGVAINGQSPLVQNCVVRSNATGGISLFASSAIISNCTVMANSAAASLAGSGGGVIVTLTSTNDHPAFVNSLIQGNSATNSGGGLYIRGNQTPGNCSLIGCVISGNAAGNLGGGVAVISANVSIINCTIAGNRNGDPVFGGGAGIEALEATVNVQNSILWYNAATGNVLEKAQVLGSHSAISLDHSSVQGLNAWQGNSNTGLNPLFTQPLLGSSAPSIAGDFQLESCSPLIDAGSATDLASASMVPTVDAAGSARSVRNVDLGAYEFAGFVTPLLSVSQQPTSVNFCPATPPSFAFDVAGTGVTWQWQVNQNDGGGFTSIADGSFYSGSTNQTLTILNPQAAMDGWQFQCVAGGVGGCTVTSIPATLNFPRLQWFVNAAANPGGDGSSWATAFNSLQSALTNSHLLPCGAEIWVAGGQYAPSFNADLQRVGFRLPPGAGIYGGFSGTETNRNQRNWQANPTVIEAGAGTLFSSVNEALDQTARLDGFILRNGWVGFDNETNASPTIANCAFINFTNYALYNSFGSPRITNCVFLHCGQAGGAVRDHSDGAIYSGCAFLQNNDAVVAESSSQLLLDRCWFAANTNSCLNIDSSSSGTVANSVFSGNEEQFGTVFFVAGGGSLDVRNSTIAGNRGRMAAGSGCGPPPRWCAGMAGSSI